MNLLVYPDVRSSVFFTSSKRMMLRLCPCESIVETKKLVAKMVIHEKVGLTFLEFRGVLAWASRSIIFNLIFNLRNNFQIEYDH